MAAPEDSGPARQVAGTAVVGREMAGGRRVAQRAEGERTAVLARWEAVGERTAERAGQKAVGGKVAGMAGKEAVEERVSGPLSCTCTLPGGHRRWAPIRL